MKSSKANVEDFFNDLRLADPEKHQIALTLRKEIGSSRISVGEMGSEIGV